MTLGEIDEKEEPMKIIKSRIIRSGLVAMTLAAAVSANATTTASLETGNKELLTRGFVFSSNPYLIEQLRVDGSAGYAYISQRHDLTTGKGYGSYVGAGKDLSAESFVDYKLNLEAGFLSLPDGSRCPELDANLSYVRKASSFTITPQISAVAGAKDFPGKYYAASLTESTTIGKLSFDLTEKISFNDHYGTQLTAFTNTSLEATVGYQPSHNMKFSAGFRGLQSLRKPMPNAQQFWMKTEYTF